MSEQGLYSGREQTQIKHFILRKYLERFAHIIGSRWSTITYVDCFSGPWKAQAEGFEDTSFAIALEELRKARKTYEERGKSIQLRALFLERDPASYAKLREFADGVKDVTVETRNSELAGAVGDVLDFVKRGGRSSFPFFFIDPTGWTGFEMRVIAPLLRQQPGEVLVNFMTDYIRRFIDHPDQQTRQQFSDLFGSDSVRDCVLTLSDPQDREDALFWTYAESVRQTGRFGYVCAAIVLYPEIDRRYFHLIYATRNRRGVEVFKGVEQRAMALQEQTRAEAKQRKRVKKTRQPELFAAIELPQSHPVDDLRTRYLRQARERLQALLQARGRVPYDDSWDLALSFPLVWERDVKEWVAEWRKAGALRIEGMESGQRVPKLGKRNLLVWQGPDQQGGTVS